VRQEAVSDAGLWIFLRDVREWKDVGRIEEVDERVAVARGLRETVVEAAAAGAGNLRNHAVEDFPVVLAAVESVIQVGPKESAALRDAESRRAADRACRN
jgi:hypothetical protein